MSGAVFDYDFGPKRNWRRWAWNRIAERIRVPAKDAVVVYLPGATDYDRSLALSKGFRENNLIGVERNASSLRGLRDRQRLVVQGDFLQAVSCLSASRKVDVVFGDFCCGLHPNLIYFLTLWVAMPTMLDTVYLFNLKRGRDPQSNKLRDTYRWAFDSVFIGDLEKHRGAFVAAAYVGSVVSLSMRERIADIENITEQESQEFHRRIGITERRMNWSLESYKSESIFDSVVFNAPWGEGQAAPDVRVLMRKLVRTERYEKTRRSVSAVLAHRTMRGGK